MSLIHRADMSSLPGVLLTPPEPQRLADPWARDAQRGRVMAAAPPGWGHEDDPSTLLGAKGELGENSVLTSFPACLGFPGGKSGFCDKKRD